MLDVSAWHLPLRFFSHILLDGSVDRIEEDDEDDVGRKEIHLWVFTGILVHVLHNANE